MKSAILNLAVGSPSANTYPTDISSPDKAAHAGIMSFQPTMLIFRNIVIWLYYNLFPHLLFARELV